MKRKIAQRRRRGLTLYEMLIYLAFLGVIGLIGTRIIGSSLRLTNDAVRSRETIHAFDAATRQLRSDVWSATSMRVASATEIVLTQTDGFVITWSIRGDQMIRSVAEPAPATAAYPRPPGEVSFRVNGAALIVVVDGIDRISLLSQMMLLAKDGA